MNITQNETLPPKAESYESSFHSIGQILKGFVDRHNLGQLLDEMSPDEAVDHILKKRKERSM